MTKSKNSWLLITSLGLIFFCFSISAGLLFQKLLLPNLGTMLAPGTTLTADSAYYNSVAIEMADKIKLEGWANWHLFPNTNSSINSSILAFLYVVFGYDPTLAIPLNALFHALGGILVFMIVIELSSSHMIGVCAGIVASFLFILFPSALNWYGQILKDGYVIVGLLSILLIWLKGMSVPINTKKFFYLIMLNMLAICFLGMIKAYLFKLTLLCATIILIVTIGWRLVAKNKNSWIFFAYVLVTCAPTYVFLNNIDAFSLGRSGESYATVKDIPTWEWQRSTLLPIKVDKQLETVAKTRVGLIDFGVKQGAQSMVDTDIRPNNSVEVMSSLPRAFQVGLFAPFPTSWLDKISMTRLLASVEMMVIYICLSGLIPLFKMNRSPQVILAFFFSAFFLTIYGFIVTNVGTLYRVRYPFELIMVLLGVIGWVSYLDKKGLLQQLMDKLKKKSISNIPLIKEETEEKNLNRKRVISAGIIVSFLTLIGFVGFFLRDVLMAHAFGFGEALDGFFLALLIPMFIITVFCMPLGTAFLPFLNRLFKSASDFQVNQVVSHLVSIVIFVMVFVSIALYFLSPAIFNSLQMTVQGAATSTQFSTLLILALIILIVGGVVILGNTVLMAKEKLIIPSAAQIVTPIIAILALILFGSAYGVVSVMAGMMVGLLINLVIIQIQLKKYKTTLMPSYNGKINKMTMGLWGQYFPLLASAFFTGVMLPIDTMLAATLENGDVSIFNLGMKIVLFISGLLSAVVSNVMLPYFSSIVERNKPHLAKKELSFFMLIATFISVPASVVLYVWSEQIVGLIFFGKVFSENDLLAVKNVMQYSVVQIPFFICNILLLKYATATRHLRVVTISAFIGLLLNISLSLALMPQMGVAGIALATSIAMMVSSAIILMMLSFYEQISIMDTIMVLLNWMLFLTLIVALHFQSVPSAVMTMMTYGILLFGYAKLINHKGGLLAI